METRILEATPEALLEAAEILKDDGVVAIPTETVYGLAANALSAQAVARIYEAKGRPAFNPLIVHVHDVAQARELAAEWPEAAETLARAFWPGPLTLVVRKKPGLVPDITTAGNDSVAVRCPAHPVARQLIAQCGFPLAAPSANRSNALSPTTAQHVLKSLVGRIPLILDGGRCKAGIESTIVSLLGRQPELLRPGVLTAELLSQVLGSRVIFRGNAASSAGAENSAPVAPGQLAVHYAPKTPLLLVDFRQVSAFLSRQMDLGRWGLMAIEGENEPEATGSETVVLMPADSEAYASELYGTLHRLDAAGLDYIVAELPPDDERWLAVRDRLGRAGRRITTC